MSERTVETAGPALAKMVMGWDGPMWRYRHPWGPWVQGLPPTERAATAVSCPSVPKGNDGRLQADG